MAFPKFETKWYPEQTPTIFEHRGIVGLFFITAVSAISEPELPDWSLTDFTRRLAVKATEEKSAKTPKLERYKMPFIEFPSGAKFPLTEGKQRQVLVEIRPQLHLNFHQGRDVAAHDLYQQAQRLSCKLKKVGEERLLVGDIRQNLTYELTYHYYLDYLLNVAVEPELNRF
jgi:hypothetical protein